MSPLYFAGQPGSGYGWGICNQHLLTELSRLRPVTLLEPHHPDWRSPNLPGDLFTPLMDHDFNPATPARGRRNFAYTFFENELTDQAVANAPRFERVFAGCTWCCDRMREKGIDNGVVLLQGVDCALFRPNYVPASDDRFVIFSGGKLELRKGQDLVLAAFRILQQKYPDIVLVNSWVNQWPASLQTMAASKHIRFELGGGSWHEQMNRLYALNGLDPARITTLPILSHEKMVRAYQLSDIGLFPNRGEGGTNLVMMEYMACGKPVIATYGTGHCDILHEANALLLRDLKPFRLVDSGGRLLARWVTPSLEEILERVEYAYHHRAEVRRLGLQAAKDMQTLTWARTAQTIARTLDECAG